MIRIAVTVFLFFGFSAQALNSRSELYGIALGIAASVKSVVEVLPGFLKKESRADQIKSLRKQISKARLTSDFEKADELEEELRNLFEEPMSAKEKEAVSPAPVFIPGVKQACGGKCHITGQPLREPVIASDGYTYERRALIDWFNKTGDILSPATGEKLNRELFYPNYLVKKLDEQKDFEDLKCAIGCDYFQDPMVAADGHTYESDSITGWFGDKTTVRSPMTNSDLIRRDLIRNRCIEKMFLYVPSFKIFEESVGKIYQEYEQGLEKLGFGYRFYRRLQELEKREALERQAVVENEITQVPDPHRRDRLLMDNNHRTWSADWWPTPSRDNVLERYDRLTGARTAEYARRYFQSNFFDHSRRNMAASLLPQPERDVVVGDFRFTRDDIQDLLSMVSNDLAADNEPFASEPHPHTLHSRIVELVRTDRPMVLDINSLQDLTLHWNYPIDQLPTIEEFDSVPEGFPVRIPQQGGRVKYQKWRFSEMEYTCWIEYDSNGRPLASGWYENPRALPPDLVWVPTARGDLSRRETWPNISSYNPEINPQVVFDIYSESL